MIVDCHVNIFEDRHVTPLMREQTQFARPGSIGYKADADTLYAAMKGSRRWIQGGRMPWSCWNMRSWI